MIYMNKLNKLAFSILGLQFTFFILNVITGNNIFMYLNLSCLALVSVISLINLYLINRNHKRAIKKFEEHYNE